MGEKIKERREAAGLSQAELAAMLGVHNSTISLWENGVTSPKMGNLIKLAELFECKPGDLF